MEEERAKLRVLCMIGAHPASLPCVFLLRTRKMAAFVRCNRDVCLYFRTALASWQGTMPHSKRFTYTRELNTETISRGVGRGNRQGWEGRERPAERAAVPPFPGPAGSSWSSVGTAVTEKLLDGSVWG